MMVVILARAREQLIIAYLVFHILVMDITFTPSGPGCPGAPRAPGAPFMKKKIDSVVK